MRADVNPTHHDAIIIGAGHNGLVCAAYLARAGWSTLVLERRPVIGGATVTEEIVPGFKFSRAAYVNSLFRPEIVHELKLKKHGFQMLPRNPSSFTPALDGRYLLLGTDAELNQREVSKFSARDAELLPAYERRLDRLARFLEPLLDRPPPRVFEGAWWDRAQGLAELAKLGWRSLALGSDALLLMEMLTAPATRILDRWFESEPLRGTLATDAVIGTLASPSSPSTAYVLLHHVMGETDGARGVWGYVRGGMGALADAVASAARAAGAEIQVSSPVRSISVENGRARGVVLQDGTEVRARCVLSGADPCVTFLSLLDAADLPDDFRRQVSGIDMRSGATKINVALDALPDFAALPGDRGGPQHRGTIHIASTIAEIESAYRDAAGGQESRRPVIEMTIPSVLDDSVAPAGKHVASLFVQFTPYEPATGSWDDSGRRDTFAKTVFGLIDEYAPGFSSRIIDYEVLTPVDLEQIFALSGGNIFHGAMNPDQLFWMRPVPGWSSHRTPVAGLYMCGAGAHPGGGVLGAPGRNAARAALRDLG